MLRVHPLSLLLPLLLFLTPPVGAQPLGQERASPGALAPSQSGIEAQALPDAPTWARMLEFDRRVSFSPGTTELAREQLLAGGLGPDRRSAAWLALASSGASDLRATFVRGAQALSGVRQYACIFALGALRDGTDAELLALAEDPRESVRAAALVAMVASSRPALRRWVEEQALDPRARDATAAQQALALFGSGSSAPFEAGRYWLALRKDAARHYGLIDGQSWLVYCGRELAQNTGFLEVVVLRSSSRIVRPGVRDMLLGTLLKSTGPERLRAAVRGMPRELSRLVDSGLWLPADDSEWRVIFDEAESYGQEAFVQELIQRGLQQPALSWRAAALALRCGVVDLGAFADEDLGRLAPAQRIEALRALGEGGRPGSLQRVMAWLGDESLPVAAAAQIAAMRLGVRQAETSVRVALANKQHRMHKVLLVELTRVVRDPRAAALLDELLFSLEGELRLFVASALARDGSRAARAVVREALDAQPPLEPERALVLVSALARRPVVDDLSTLRAWFPAEPGPRTMTLNMELAGILAQLSDPVVMPLLQTALWRSRFEVSMLAGARIVESDGLSALREHALNPPALVRSEDVRRVGYALGLWGGFPELDALTARLRHNSGAPAVQGAMLGVLSTRTN